MLDANATSEFCWAQYQSPGGVYDVLEGEGKTGHRHKGSETEITGRAAHIQHRSTYMVFLSHYESDRYLLVQEITL